MSITIQQLMKRLDTDEPNYATLAAIGSETLSHLSVLVSGDDPGLASKAAYLASLIDGEEAASVVALAGISAVAVIRAAAAAGLSNMKEPHVSQLADRMLDDSDAGVRKLALRAIGKLNITALIPKIKLLAAKDNNVRLRLLAKSELKQFSAARADGGEPSLRTKRAKRSKAKRAKAKK